MRPSSSILLLFAALVAVLGPSRTLAAGPGDGGTAGDASPEAAAPDDGGSPFADDASSDDGGGSGGASLACDGALCDTTTGGTTCGIARGVGRGGGAQLVSAALLLGAVGLGTLRRGRAKERKR